MCDAPDSHLGFSRLISGVNKGVPSRDSPMHLSCVFVVRGKWTLPCGRRSRSSVCSEPTWLWWAGSWSPPSACPALESSGSPRPPGRVQKTRGDKGSEKREEPPSHFIGKSHDISEENCNALLCLAAFLITRNGQPSLFRIADQIILLLLLLLLINIIIYIQHSNTFYWQFLKYLRHLRVFPLALSPPSTGSAASGWTILITGPPCGSEP